MDSSDQKNERVGFRNVDSVGSEVLEVGLVFLEVLEHPDVGAAVDTVNLDIVRTINIVDPVARIVDVVDVLSDVAIDNGLCHFYFFINYLLII